MRITDVYSAKAVAAQWTEVASNKIPYLGAGLFPAKKKMGLDLKWLKGNKGLPVSLAPSNFDAKSTLRTRPGFKFDQTEMPFFRESMLVKETDEQEIMRVQEASDPYAVEVLSHIYNDANTLLEGAEVVPERMRMQLLCPTNNGSPQILISANGVQYSYNYDADGSYATDNYKAMSAATDKWTDHVNSDPMADIEAAADAVEAKTGSRPTIAIMARETFNHLKANEKVKAAILAQNATANIFMNDAIVKQAFKDYVGVTIVVYSKQYKDESGTAQQFYANGYCTLIPEGSLGYQWYGTTPEMRTLMGSGTANVSVVNTGVTIAVSVTEDPVNTKTTVSEITLPSYERMNETYVIKAY